MKLIAGVLNQIKKVFSLAKGNYQKGKNASEFLQKYKHLKGNKQDKIVDFEFNRGDYNNYFKDFVKLLQMNNYDISKKSITLTIGEYSDNERNLYKLSGFSSQDINVKNSQLFENSYVHWTVLPDSVDFDIAQEIIFHDSTINIEKSGLKDILYSIRSIKENSKISSIILRVKSNLFFRTVELENEQKDKKQYVLNRYYQALNYINKVFEYKIPVYILLTDLDEVYGFESFLKLLSEKEKTQIFGISNNREIDEFYTEEMSQDLVFQFKNIIKSFLSKKILEDVDQQDFKNILFYVNNLFYVLDQFVGFIDYLFLNKTIDSSYMFRGFYLCGTDNNNLSSLPLGIEKYQVLMGNSIDLTGGLDEQYVPRKIYFFHDLYRRKIVKEFSFNIPSIGLVNKNKAHQFYSIALLSIVSVSLPILTYNLYLSLNRAATNIEQMFDNLSEHVVNKENEKKSNIQSSKVNLTELFDIFKAVERKKSNNIATKLAPLSLLSNFDRKVNAFLERMIIVFEVRPVHNLLLEKLKSTSAVEAIDATKSSPEDSYNRILTYIKTLDFLEKSSKDFNGFAIELKVDDLNSILQRLLDIDLSDFLPKTNIIIYNAGRKYSYKKISYIDYKPVYTKKFEILFNKMASDIKNEYLIQDNTKSLIAYVDKPRENIKNKDYFAYLNSITLFLDNIAKKIDFYTASSQIVTSAGTEIKLDRLNFIVKNNLFLDDKILTNLDIKIKESIKQRNEAILDYNSVILGPIFEKAEDKISLKLSKNVSALKLLITDFNNADFIKPFKDRFRSNNIGMIPDSFDWNNIDVDNIAKNIDTYNKYVGEKVILFPQSIQNYVRDASLLGISQALVTDFNSKSDGGNNLRSLDTDKKVLAINRKKDNIIKILKFVNENDEFRINNDLKSATVEETQQYLKYFKEKLLKVVRYEPVQGNFDLWDGLNPPGYAPYQVYDSRELTDYISNQNLEISKILADYVQPLLEISTQASTGIASRNSAEYMFWKQINDEVNSKQPNSSYRSLYNYIFGTLTTVTSDNCMSIINTKKVDHSKNDYFSLKQTEIQTMLSDRCRKLLQNKVSISFNKIVQSFNANLAGKFPFVEDSAADKADDVDQGTLNDFFSQFYTFMKDENNVSFISSSKDEKWREVKNFLIKMKNIMVFMDGIRSDSRGPNTGAFNFIVDFNQTKNSELNTFALLERKVETSTKTISNLGLDNQISWNPSEEIAFSFRWAKNFDRVPYILSAVNSSKYNINVDAKSKSISFVFKDKWSLLHLLRKYAKARDNWSYSQETVFKIPIRSAKALSNSNTNTTMAIVSLKVKFIDTVRKTVVPMPVFPTQAGSVLISNL